jgi:hypothetical protein
LIAAYKAKYVAVFSRVKHYMSSADNKKKSLPLVLPPPQPNINQALESLPVFNHEALAASRDEDQYESGPRILVGLKGMPLSIDLSFPFFWQQSHETDYVFDVTSLGEFLGSRGELSNWAFKDISYALTKNSSLQEDADVEGYFGLSTKELEMLDNWVKIFL